MGKEGVPSSIICMHGEPEEHGYANNSRLQNFTFHTYAKPHLAQALIQLRQQFVLKSAHAYQLSPTTDRSPHSRNAHQHESTSNGCPIQGSNPGLFHVPQCSHQGLLHEQPLACPQVSSDHSVPLHHQPHDGHQSSCGRSSSFPMHVDNTRLSCHHPHYGRLVMADKISGMVSQEEMDMFNIPTFFCHLSDMQESLKEFSSDLKVLKLEVLKECKSFPEHEEKNLQAHPEAFGEFWSRFAATLMEPMMQAYLGSSRARMFFKRLKQQATLKAHLSTSMNSNIILAILQRI